jgi:hypothetical protein
MFNLKRLPYSGAELAQVGAKGILYCETAQHPRPESAATTRSIYPGIECVRLDEIVSTRDAAVLEYEIVLIPIYGSRVPEGVYTLCNLIRSVPCPLWRMEPTVVLMLQQSLLDSVYGDLRNNLGCDLIFRPDAAQLLFRVHSEMAYRARARRQGVLIERITAFDWKLIGPLASPSFRIHNRQERRLMVELMSDRRIFDITELEFATGYKEEHIKVPIQRIREKYDEARIPAGICIPREMFLENVEEAHGYRLFATVRDRPRQ